MDKNYTKTMRRNRIETIFDACKYRGCTNRRLSKRGVHLFRFPLRGDPRLLSWIKNTGNKLILSWSLSTLRKAGVCGDHFSDDSFHTLDRAKLKPDAVPQPFKDSELDTASEKGHDHTYAKQIVEEEIDAEIAADRLNIISESGKFEHAANAKTPASHPDVTLPVGRPLWRSNPTFMRTYSRKLTFKDVDDSMGWAAIKPGCAEDNGGLKATEALKQSVATIKTAAAKELIKEHENREIRELRMINIELRRRNKILRIENFKLQLRLATAEQCKSPR